MVYWKTRFRRCNWTFQKMIEQICDVVFESEHEELTDENCAEIEDEAFKALWVQSKWKGSDIAFMNIGWSSALSDGKYERVYVPHIDREIEKPSPDKPVVACSVTTPDDLDMNDKPRSYRVTHFYKLVPYDRYKITGDRMTDMIVKSNKDEAERRGVDTSKLGWRLLMCLPEEAQVVSGDGVCEIFVLIREITVGKLVNWNDLMIRQEQGQYVEKVADQTETDIVRLNLDMQAKINEFVEKLGLDK